jgi:hypothetical protein
MEIPYLRWYPAIAERRSYRIYDSTPPAPEALQAVRTVCETFRPFDCARVVLVEEPQSDVFTGVFGSYGKVKNAAAFLAFIGDTVCPNVQEHVGYTGEGAILEATALGLNTCWVAGFFDRKKASAQLKLAESERLLAVSPLGYAVKNEDMEEKVMSGFGRHRQRIPADRMLGAMTSNDVAGWQKQAIEAARLAPSAINRQPWGFKVRPESITVYVRTAGPEFHVSKRLDCGIAMMHLEVAALSAGIRGSWEFLAAPNVAKFVTRVRTMPVV